MAYDVDLLVLGGGAAGLTAAGTAANLGAKTMMVERDRLGGDCTWTGCVPSKTLLHHADLRAAAVAAGADPGPVDFAAVIGDVHTTREEVYHDADRPEIFEGFGIEVVSGEAAFTGPHAARIETADGARHALAGDWRFSPGDDPRNADPATDDRTWTSIRVPGTWEPQGFRGLGGLAWYRTRVPLSVADAAQDLVLALGRIADLL